MSLINLGEKPSLATQFLNEIRGKDNQHDRMRFRKNLERMGEIMAYEISRTLGYESCTVNSPLAAIVSRKIKEQPILLTVMRAGLPYFQGFLNYFDQVDAGFIGACRKEGVEIEIDLEYLATPELAGREVILIDPMLATGKSFIRSINALMKHGKPAHIHLASLIASPEGVQYVKENLKIPFTIWTFSLDEKLNDKFYIVPGLGDAGDLSFGEKI